MEQLTRDKSIETFQIVRKLIRFIPKLPQQAAFSLYNYIIGYIMFYVRHPREKGKKQTNLVLFSLVIVKCIANIYAQRFSKDFLTPLGPDS